MNDNKYNGFASEEQYEAAMNIIKNAIDEYTDTIMVEFKNNDIIVEVETKELNHYARYFVNIDGVFYVNLESENMPIVECKIFAALNKCANTAYTEMNKAESIDRLTRVLNGDTNAIYYADEENVNYVKAALNELNSEMVMDNISVKKDVLEEISYSVCLMYYDAIPVIEEHYGVKFNKKGNKYYYFDKVA